MWLLNWEVALLASAGGCAEVLRVLLGLKVAYVVMNVLWWLFCWIVSNLPPKRREFIRDMVGRGRHPPKRPPEDDQPDDTPRRRWRPPF